MASPPGGAPDTLPPTLEATYPGDGAVGVPRNLTLIAEWSESIEARAAEDAFRVVPWIEDLEVRVRGKRVEVPLGLEADRTYEVSFGTEMRDLRRVPMEQPVSWRFSTGDSLFTGRIAGQVFRAVDDATGASRVSVALLGEEELDSGPLHWVRPEFLLTTSEEGTFELGVVPAGRWRLIAFDDRNRNRRIEPGREPTASHWEAVEADALREYQLVLGPPMERAPEVTRVRALHSKMVEIQFDRPVERALLEHLDVRLIPVALAGAPLIGADRVWVPLDSLGRGGRRVEVRNLPTGSPPADSVSIFELAGSTAPDLKRPGLVATTLDSTRGVVPFSGRLVFDFDEPMDTTAVWTRPVEVIRLQPPDSSAAPEEPAAVHWAGPSRLVVDFEMPDSTELGGFVEPGPALRDRAGNGAEFRLSGRLSPTGAARVIAGNVRSECAQGSVWVRAAQRGGRVIRGRCDADGSFVIHGVREGDYTLLTWADRDGDGRWSRPNPRSDEGGEPMSVAIVEAGEDTVRLAIPCVRGPVP